MPKRVIIVHGWGGSPEADWYHWLEDQLEGDELTVEIPVMPHPDKPRINEWVTTLKNVVGKPDNDMYLVGHSIGCQTILRYLETLPAKTVFGGAVFVAGWLHLSKTVTDSDTEGPIAKPWLDAPIDVEKARSHLAHSVAIFSDNDPYVPLKQNAVAFKRFGCDIVIEKHQGHFNEETDVTEAPAVYRALIHLINRKR